MNIYIGGPIIVDDYTAMQGPAPDGFHVPLMTEWQTIVDTGVSLGAWSSSNGVNLSTYLKLPMAGMRYNENANIQSRGDYGRYLVSTPSNKWNALFLSFYSSRISMAGTARSTGITVRCVKDSPAIPTSSWTTLYQGSGNAGIFHNPTDGLISISSDGTTWYTLMDKNLGATTVYNYGDTLSYANCGNYYQRGNNYGFGLEDSSQITKSSTQVDVTGYGPGNYYESSTWITTTPRQSSANDGDNLRGGVTGVVQKPEYQEFKNIYIGEYKPDYLCFTANTSGSTIKLGKAGSPTTVTLETSTDGDNWSTYTFGDVITLTNIGDKVYWRNTSETTTGFSISGSMDYYYFVMTGSIAGSGDINFLINKHSTKTLVSNHCYEDLFRGCSQLTTPPELPATTLTSGCYLNMFNSCSNLTKAPKLPATTLASSCYNNMFIACTKLEELPELPALTLPDYCYHQMFYGCSKIKISSSQSSTYTTPYRIPKEGTGTMADSSSVYNMFNNTGGSYATMPSINTTYYTSNTVV